MHDVVRGTELRMEIVIDARYLSNRYSGIATYSKSLVESLARLDTENRYCVIVHQKFKGELAVGENFEVIRHTARPVSVRTLLSLHRVGLRRPMAVYHSLFPLAPLQCPAPVLLTLHDLQPFWDPEFSARRARWVRWGYDRFYHWVYPATLRLARWIVVDSEATRQGLREYFPEHAAKAIVVPLGLDEGATVPPNSADVDRVRLKFRLDFPYLLYYGSTRPNKNLPRLVKAFAQMRRLHPDKADVQLVLVVQPDRFFADTLDTLRRENVSSAVHILPPVTEAERRALLVAARVFCFPSRYEGFGLPVLDAQAMGTPTLASTSAALPETGGDGALYVDPEDTDAMAEGLWRLVGDEEFRARLIARGRENVKRYSWEETARQTLDIYQTLF